jgi:raffinose/stachyose/melibiose transport system permease protein
MTNRRRHGINKNTRDYLIFISIPLLVYLVFFVLPNLNIIFYSFIKWNGISEVKKYIGFNNYIELVNDPIFLSSFEHTLIYTVFVIIFQNCSALLLAVLIRNKSRVNNIFRTIFFSPAILSTVSISFIWQYIYEPNIGIINVFLQNIGLGNFQAVWLGDPKIVMYSIALVHVWFSIGYSLIIFLTGLNNIPAELYECANIEGANRWKLFSKITFPLLRPATLIALVLTTIGSFKAFDFVYIMTGGGANHSSEVLATLLYKEGFAYNRIGYSATISVVLMAVVMLIAVTQLHLMRESD